MDRAYSILTVKAVEEDQRVIEGIATTPTPDRVGDIVEPDGAEFKLPLPLLWQHDSHAPIGHVTHAKVTKQGIEIKAKLAKIDEPGTLKDRLDEAWQSLKTGLVQGLSIGFKPLESARIEDTYKYRFSKWLWLELSAVTIPANAEATVTTLRSIDRQQRAVSGQSPLPVVRLSSPAAAGRRNNPKAMEPNMKTISEQIAALEAERAAKAAAMEQVQSKATEAGRTKDDAEKEEFNTLRDEIKSIDDELADLRELEKMQAAKAKPVTDVKTPDDAASRRGGVTVKQRETLPPGIEFARFAMCVAAGKGNLMQSFEIAKSRYPNNDDIITSLKAAVAAGTTTDSAWAGALVDSYVRFAGDFVEFLRPQTIIGKFGTNGIPSLRRVPFNVNIAGQTSGGAGYWVGEGQAKPLTRFAFTSYNLPWAKVANIAVLTEELLRFSNPAAEALVRDQLAKALIERLDIDFVDRNKAENPNVSPASITNGVTPITSVGNGAESVRADIASMMNVYIGANITPMTGVWIMSATTALRLSLMRNALGQKEFPDITMMGGRLEGLPVIVSEYMTSDSNGDDVVLMNAEDIWLSDDGQVVIDASREASLQMEDVTTQNGTIPTPTTMVSLWQNNMVGLRAERWINWKKRRSQAVVLLDNVNWGIYSQSE